MDAQNRPFILSEFIITSLSTSARLYVMSDIRITCVNIADPCILSEASRSTKITFLAENFLFVKMISE